MNDVEKSLRLALAKADYEYAETLLHEAEVLVRSYGRTRSR